MDDLLIDEFKIKPTFIKYGMRVAVSLSVLLYDVANESGKKIILALGIRIRELNNKEYFYQTNIKNVGY